MDLTEKQRQIIDIAKHLFFQYGLRSVTMDEIALQTGISKKTLYQNFKDKETLIEKIILNEMEKVKVLINEILSEKGLNAIDRTVKIYGLLSELHKKHPPILEHDLQRYYPEIFSTIRKFRNGNMYKAIVDNLEDGKAEGLFREDLNSEIIALLQINRGGILRESFGLKDKYGAEELVRQSLIYHLYGICSDKGRQYIEKLNL